MADENLPRAVPLVIGKDEPYPTGAPPDFSSVPLRVHPQQALTDAKDWEAQRIANLAAGGLIAGGAAITPTVGDPEAEVEGAGYVDTPRGRKKAG